MQSKVYPVELLDDTLETYLTKTPVGRRPVYVGALVALAAALLSLPVIRVPVTIQAPGVIRPILEKNMVRVPVSGRVASVLVRERQAVRRGAPLVELESSVLRGQDGTVRYRRDQVNAFIRDLERLTGSRPGALPAGAFSTPKYQRELAQLQGELGEVGERERTARLELERAEALHARAFLSAAELEARRQAVAEARAEARVVWERHHTRWQAELTEMQMERRNVEAQLADLAEQRAQHVVTSPVTGTVEDLIALSPGAYVQAGDQIAVVSPDSTLVAELLVSPRDVGLVRREMAVRLHVSAFRYTDWGFVPGRVVEIAEDFTMLERTAVFRVRATVDRSRLTLPNGATGELKKGMTLQAHMVVARRSLFDLIRDDVSDWLDPRAGAEPAEAP